MPNYVHGYVLYTMGLEVPMWYVQGGMVAVCTVGLGTRNSEFISVVQSMVDGLCETCVALLDIDPNPNGILPLNCECRNPAPVPAGVGVGHTKKTHGQPVPITRPEKPGVREQTGRHE